MAQVAETYLSEEQQVVGENKLADAEIARLLKTVQAAQFIKSETMLSETDSAFKPRSLVEIAFEAEKKRQEEATRAETVEKAAQQAAQEVLKQNMGDGDTPSPAGYPSPQPETEIFSDPMRKATSAGQAMEMIEQPDAKYDAGEQAVEEGSEQARLQRESEDAKLRAEAEEEGYKRGFESGLEAARSAEPTEEEKAIAAAREAERTELISRLEAVIAAAAGTEAVDVSALTLAIEQAVLRLASERAGLVIQENPQGLVKRIEQLVEKLKLSASAICVTLNPQDLKAVEAWRSAQNAYPNWVWRGDTQLVSGDIKLKLDGISVSDVSGLEAKAKTHTKIEDRAESVLKENIAEETTLVEEALPMETEAENADETGVDQTKTEQTKTEQTKTEQTKTEQTKTEQAEIQDTVTEEAEVEEAEVEEAEVEEAEVEEAEVEEAEVEEAEVEEVEEAEAEVEEAEVEEAEVEEADLPEDAVGEDMTIEQTGSASEEDEQSP